MRVATDKDDRLPKRHRPIPQHRDESRITGFRVILAGFQESLKRVRLLHDDDGFSARSRGCRVECRIHPGDIGGVAVLVLCFIVVWRRIFIA